MSGLSGYVEMLTKEQAAKALNCSVRTVERYMKENKLTVTYKKVGSTRAIAMFHEDEVTRLAEAITPPIKPAVVEETRQFTTEEADGLAMLEHECGEIVGIVEIDENERLAKIIELLLTTQRVRICEKLILTLDECRDLSGLSKQRLREAITTGQLKAQKIGKGWKIKRKDLEQYVDDL